MATSNVGDNMATKLDTLYNRVEVGGFAHIGDAYMAWVAAHGPEWEDVVAYIMAQTSATEFPEAWNEYWAS